MREHRDRRIDIVFYANAYETGICKVYKSENGFGFRYDLDSEKWEKLSEKCTPVTCLDRNESSHDFIQWLLSDINPYHFEIHSHGLDRHPFVSLKLKIKFGVLGK